MCKRLFAVLTIGLTLACAAGPPGARANTTTANLGLNKPGVGADSDAWGGYLNANADALDEEWAVTARGDGAYTILATDRVIRLTTAFTAARTFTLPAAASFKASQPLVIVDAAGAVSGADPLVLARAGADTIVAPSGTALTSYTVSRPRQTITLRSDGASTWTIARGFDYETGTWTPTVAFAIPGTSSFSYTTQVGNYIRIGDLVFLDFTINFTPTIGTASGSFEIRGMPFSVADIDQATGTVQGLTSNFSWPGGSYVAIYALDPSDLALRTSGSGMPNGTFQAAHFTNGSAHVLRGSMIYKVP